MVFQLSGETFGPAGGQKWHDGDFSSNIFGCQLKSVAACRCVVFFYSWDPCRQFYGLDFWILKFVGSCRFNRSVVEKMLSFLFFFLHVTCLSQCIATREPIIALFLPSQGTDACRLKMT